MDGPTMALVGVSVPVVFGLVGAAFGYGRLSQRVSDNRNNIEESKETYKAIDTKLDDVRDRLTILEQTVDGKGRQ